MLKVIDFLKFNSFKNLEDIHGVSIRLSNCKRFFSLNYSQIASDVKDELANECRGMILAKVDHSAFDSNYENIIPGDLKIIAMPFKRFFNLNQRENEKINLLDPKLKIQLKLDGTLAIVYFNEVLNEWAMGTRGVPEADVKLEDNIHTFRTLFDKAVFETTNLYFNEFTALLDKKVTYMFELTTPFNNLVVHNSKSTITLLGARNKLTLQELDVSTILDGVPHAPTYAFDDINKAVEFVDNMDPSKFEGLVICDSNYNRVKIKNKEHCLLSKMRESLGSSDKNILSLILREKDDDIIGLVPKEIKEKILSYKEKVNNLIKFYNKELTNSLKFIDNSLDVKQKRANFAKTINSVNAYKIWQTPFFLLYDNKINNFSDFINLNKNKENEFSDIFLNNFLNQLEEKFYQNGKVI